MLEGTPWNNPSYILRVNRASSEHLFWAVHSQEVLPSNPTPSTHIRVLTLVKRGFFSSLKQTKQKVLSSAHHCYRKIKAILGTKCSVWCLGHSRYSTHIKNYFHQWASSSWEEQLNTKSSGEFSQWINVHHIILTYLGQFPNTNMNNLKKRAYLTFFVNLVKKSQRKSFEI